MQFEWDEDKALAMRTSIEFHSNRLNSYSTIPAQFPMKTWSILLTTKLGTS